MSVVDADSGKTEATTDRARGAEQAPATELWVERTGEFRFTGRSTRNAEVLVGRDYMDGVFTPGELLKIALAACTAMSADSPLSRRLGGDFSGRVRVSGVADREAERYPRLDEVFELDLSEFSDAEKQKIRDVVTRSVDRACTVGRTLKAGAEVELEVAPGPDSEPVADE